MLWRIILVQTYICGIRSFSQIISYLFFPGTLAIAGFAILRRFQAMPSGPEELWFPVLMFLVAPVIPLLLLIRLKLVDDIHVSNRSQRSLSYTFAIAFALLYVVFTRGDDWYLWHWGTAVLLSLILLFLTNIFWIKASAHMAGTGGFLMLTLLAFSKGESLAWFCLAILLASLVYLARKTLKAHTHLELWVGFALGFIACFMVFRF